MTEGLSCQEWRGRVVDLRTFLMTRNFTNELDSLAKLATIE